MAKANILFGLGIIENAFHETAQLRCLPGSEDPARTGLLEEA